LARTSLSAPKKKRNSLMDIMEQLIALILRLSVKLLAENSALKTVWAEVLA